MKTIRVKTKHTQQMNLLFYTSWDQCVHRRGNESITVSESWQASIASDLDDVAQTGPLL